MLLSLGMHAQHMFIVIKQTCMSIFMKLHYSSINAFMSVYKDTFVSHLLFVHTFRVLHENGYSK